MMWLVLILFFGVAAVVITFTFSEDFQDIGFLPQRLLGLVADVPLTPATIAKWEDSVRQAAEDAGWEYVADRQDGLCFTRSQPEGEVTVRVMRNHLYTVYRMDCEIVPRVRIPEHVHASFRSHIDILMQLLRDEPADARGRFSFDSFQMVEANVRVLLYCFELSGLIELSPDREALLKSFDIEDGRIQLGFGFRHGEDVSDVAGRERAWEKTFNAYGRALEISLTLARALEWNVRDVDEFLDRVLRDPRVDAFLWRHAASIRMKPLDATEQVVWLVDQTIDPSATRERWMASVPELLMRDKSHPAFQSVFERALEEGCEALMRILVQRDYALVMAAMRHSQERVRWLVTLLEPEVGLLESQRRSMLALVEPSLVLSPELDIKSRGILLSGILSVRDTSQTRELVYMLLRGSDDDALVEIMTTLSVYANAEVAASVADFLSDPEQIDTQREYQALLTLVKALARLHADEIRTPDVERFLCHCIAHEDERVASMALALVSDIGEQASLDALLPLLNSTELAIPQASIGRAMRTIRIRLGEDMEVFTGGLTIAQGSGGELTLTAAEAGAISMSE